MSHSLAYASFNQDTSPTEWEENQHPRNILKRPKEKTGRYNAIFSDDEDEGPVLQANLSSRQLHQYDSKTKTGYIDPALSSSTYHIHQADSALATLKHALMDDDWKKALKHKSGVMVYMKNGVYRSDKTPVFKGEAIIYGFSPQSIFYVIGMRKLWDEQYEDGNLVENLNDTTSLTYESMKPTTTSKSRDLALVEKIECAQNGSILFACTSVETPRIPKVHGKTRASIKLQGWMLEPMSFSESPPATKVTFVIQENMKGWVPGFAKKTLARRPLVIAKIAEYLERKAERMRAQSAPLGYNQRPSIVNPALLQHTRNKSSSSILLGPAPQNGVKKHISFAQKDTTYTPLSKEDKHEEEEEEEDVTNQSSSSGSHTVTLDTNMITQRTTSLPEPKPAPVSPKLPKAKAHLYPAHRHSIQKIRSLELLKRLTASKDLWNVMKQSSEDSHTTCYSLNRKLLVNQSNSHTKKDDVNESEAMSPFIRVDGTISGGWTPEQLCSMVHCFGARKKWDACFGDGKIIERFSQKDYLVHLICSSHLPMAQVDFAAISSIETDPASGTVYTAACSVVDPQIPSNTDHIRASSDICGWVFRPSFNQQGKVSKVDVSFVYHIDFRHQIPAPILQDWIQLSLQPIENMKQYLTKNGCPPYIRRVAGKVVLETFDTVSNQYKLTIIAKHEPSDAYQARKRALSSKQKQLWCTDIRFHEIMFPHGLDIQVEPHEMIQFQVTTKGHKCLKLFTTEQAMDGKQISLTMSPLSPKKGRDAHSYCYNGELFPPTPSVKPAAPSIDVSNTTAHAEKADKEIKDEQLVEPTLQENTRKEMTENPVQVPKGYVLVPENPSTRNNMVIITDELSFNGQQLSVMLLAMVLCYYMGKLTSCHCSV
ncbi:hypothetical protein EDC96DRAFT_244951 [Choanephora cucurbitarum]|nr:hypothetical protein EDC96DRAFT_244951 [Choanephora cucurbitarum]